MKSQSRNQTGQIIPRSLSLILYLTLTTITGTFFIESSIASEITAPNDTPLLSKNSPPMDLSELECGDANTIHLRLLIQNTKMRNVIMRYKGVDSLSAQEKNALDVITKLITITDEGEIDIRNHNKHAKDAKDKDDYACNVLMKVFEASKPLLESMKSGG